MTRPTGSMAFTDSFPVDVLRKCKNDIIIVSLEFFLQIVTYLIKSEPAIMHTSDAL